MDEVVPSSENSQEELSEEEKSEIKRIAGEININDANAIFHYGAGIQEKISDFADNILSEVKARDTSHIGKVLSNLMTKMKELNIDSLPVKSEGFLSKIPLLSFLADKTREFMTRYQSVSGHIVKIVEELHKAKSQLMQDIDMLGSLHEKNLTYYRGVSMFILAGEAKLAELKEVILPEKKSAAEASGDAMELQGYRDMVQLASRLEKKVHDLKLSRTIALQAGPQIRLVQAMNQELAEKIQSSILNTIPLWKNQMVIAISLIRQKQVLDLSRNVSDTTREILEKNAELLHTSSHEIVQEAEKGIVDIDTLKKVNAHLISTIEETIGIQKEGRIRRQEAERELKRIERELKEKLLDVKNNLK